MLPQYTPPAFPENVELTRAQQAVAEALRRPLTVPLLDGVLVQNIPLTTTTTNVQHGLGRSAQGWIVTARDAGGDVYRVPAQERGAAFLAVRATSPVTVDLWIF